MSIALGGIFDIEKRFLEKRVEREGDRHKTFCERDVEGGCGGPHVVHSTRDGGVGRNDQQLRRKTLMSILFLQSNKNVSINSPINSFSSDERGPRRSKIYSLFEAPLSDVNFCASITRFDKIIG